MRMLYSVPMERQEHSSSMWQLARNHQVTAFVRSPEKITRRHPNLQGTARRPSQRA